GRQTKLIRIVRQESLAAFTPVIQRLSANLSDVTQTRCACASGLLCGIVAFGLEESLARRSLKSMRKKHAVLVNALCVFFLTPITMPQMAELCAALTRCEGSCDMSDADVYYLHSGLSNNGPHVPQGQSESDFSEFVDLSFRMLVRLIVDLRPGALEMVYQGGHLEQVTDAHAENPNSNPKGYEEMDRFLVPNAEYTVGTCYRSFQLTACPIVLIFVDCCLKAFPARFCPAVVNQPGFVTITVDEVQRSVEEQLHRHANGDDCANLEIYKKRVTDCLGSVWAIITVLSDEKERRKCLGENGVALYRLLVDLIDLHEPRNVFAGIPVDNASEGDPDTQRFKTLDHTFHATRTLWRTLTSGASDEEENLNRHDFPLDYRVVAWTTGNDGRGELVTSGMRRSVFQQVLIRLVMRPRETVYSDSDKAEMFEKYELLVMEEAFKYLLEFTTRTGCANVDCWKKPGPLDAPLATCGGCGVHEHVNVVRGHTVVIRLASPPALIDPCARRSNAYVLLGKTCFHTKGTPTRTGLSCNCRLFEAFKNISADIAALDNPKALLQRDGFELTEGELRALENVPGILVEAERLGSELVRVNGRVAADILSTSNLSMATACAGFLAANNFPVLSSVRTSEHETSTVEDFIIRATVMRLMAQANIVKQLLDSEQKDLSVEEFGTFVKQPSYMGLVQGWEKRWSEELEGSQCIFVLHLYKTISSEFETYTWTWKCEHNKRVYDGSHGKVISAE
ncbi:hypothetical protein BDV98DRAFT_641125, partial [Pterulicium gracile]